MTENGCEECGDYMTSPVGATSVDECVLGSFNLISNNDS